MSQDLKETSEYEKSKYPEFQRVELPQLTGVRGIAASLVILFHLRELSDDSG